MVFPITPDEIAAKVECGDLSNKILRAFSELSKAPDPTELVGNIEDCAKQLTTAWTKWSSGAALYAYIDEILEKARTALRVFLQGQEACRLREEEAKRTRLRALSTIDLTTVSEDSAAGKDAPSQCSKGKRKAQDTENEGNKPTSKRQKYSQEIHEDEYATKCNYCKRHNLPCIRQDGRGRTCKACNKLHIHCDRVLNDGSFESLTEDVLNLRHKFEESRDAMVKYNQYAIIMASRAMHGVSYMSGRLNALERVLQERGNKSARSSTDK